MRANYCLIAILLATMSFAGLSLSHAASVEQQVRDAPEGAGIVQAKVGKHDVTLQLYNVPNLSEPGLLLDVKNRTLSTLHAKALGTTGGHLCCIYVLSRPCRPI